MTHLQMYVDNFRSYFTEEYQGSGAEYQLTITECG